MNSSVNTVTMAICSILLLTLLTCTAADAQNEDMKRLEQDTALDQRVELNQLYDTQSLDEQIQRTGEYKERRDEANALEQSNEAVEDAFLSDENFVSNQQDDEQVGLPVAGADSIETKALSTDQCLRPLDIVFMLDASGSVQPSNFALMKTFVSNIVGLLTVSENGTHVAVISFDSTASVIFDLNKYTTTAAVQSAIGGIVYTQGGTNFNSALTLAFSNVFTATNGARLDSDVMKVAILFTDGQDSSGTAVATAQKMRRAGIIVMAVGIGSGISYKNLISIVDTPSNLFNSTDFKQLGTTLAKSIVKESCNAANRCSNKPCLNGGTCSSKGSDGFTCSCLAGFTGSRCQIKLNPCSSKPCLNGGTCSYSGSSYSCSCPTGYSGSRCQTSSNYCASKPCLNGGACYNRGSTYYCRCLSGYTGSRCQTAPSANEYCDKCLHWYSGDSERDRSWLNQLNLQFPCPCKSTLGLWSHKAAGQACDDWETDWDCARHGLPNCSKFQPGADGCMRSARTTSTGAGQKCCYSCEGELLGPDHPGAGHPDKATDWKKHQQIDVEPYNWCCQLCNMKGFCEYYKELRKGSNAHC